MDKHLVKAGAEIATIGGVAKTCGGNVLVGCVDFSAALKLLKQGMKVARMGWNGKDMFVVMQKGYPQGIPINKNTAEATGIPEGTVCKFLPYLMMKTVHDEFVPWLASQTDILAEDWYITMTEAEAKAAGGNHRWTLRKTHATSVSQSRPAIPMRLNARNSGRRADQTHEQWHPAAQ